MRSMLKNLALQETSVSDGIEFFEDKSDDIIDNIYNMLKNLVIKKGKKRTAD